MATYDYRCERDGVFELTLPIGTAPTDAPCPECGEEAPRIFSAPLTTPITLDRSGPGGMTPIPAPPGRGGPPGGGMMPPMTAPMRGGFPPH
ncbi:MAG TPA: zinc ribbon domain-containing protein [Miltoncostaeaceae bacterium]|jgi:putative FmdB family regulatory protein|nr:zinc ribbon domain-containing protein [Miltoncostaeaceae bacterium]